GHHSGLPDPESLKARLLARSKDRIVLEAIQDAVDRLPQLVDVRSAKLPVGIAEGTPLEKELFFRFLFSALVDADYLDTESHFRPKEAEARTTSKGIEYIAEQFLSNYHRRFADVDPTPVNQVRREVFEACQMAAAKP